MFPAVFTFLVVLLTAAAHAGHTPQCTTQHVSFTFIDGTVRDMPLTICPPARAETPTPPRSPADDRHTH